MPRERGENGDMEENGSLKLSNLLGNVNLETFEQAVQRNKITDYKDS